MKNPDSKEIQGVFTSDPHGDIYEIQIKGQLDESWSDWFEGLELRPIDNGETVLFGHIQDQAALMGILNKLNNLNLTLLSVSNVDQTKPNKNT